MARQQRPFRGPSDVAAHFGARSGDCRAIRQSDEVYCPDCGLRWSLNEARPECPSK